MNLIFGPVNSRRLGLSLGIDLIPFKTCNFNCIYCQLGATITRQSQRQEFVAPEEVLRQLDDWLSSNQIRPDYITFSGSGEPTLHLALGEIIRTIKARYQLPVAVITNGSLLWLEAVQNDLLAADLVMPSLDAVSPHIFETINRPEPSLDIATIIQGLIDFRQRYTGQIWLEILFCRGVNDHPDELAKLKAVVDQIRPDKIQINTVDRPPVEDYAAPLRRESLARIEELFGQRAEVIAHSPPKAVAGSIAGEQEAIVSLLQRHSCTVRDMIGALGLDETTLNQHIDTLVRAGILTYRSYNGQLFWSAAIDAAPTSSCKNSK